MLKSLIWIYCTIKQQPEFNEKKGCWGSVFQVNSAKSFGKHDSCSSFSVVISGPQELAGRAQNCCLWLPDSKSGLLFIKHYLRLPAFKICCLQTMSRHDFIPTNHQIIVAHPASLNWSLHWRTLHGKWHCQFTSSGFVFSLPISYKVKMWQTSSR